MQCAATYPKHLLFIRHLQFRHIQVLFVLCFFFLEAYSISFAILFVNWRTKLYVILIFKVACFTYAAKTNQRKNDDNCHDQRSLPSAFLQLSAWKNLTSWFTWFLVLCTVFKLNFASLLRFSVCDNVDYTSCLFYPIIGI